MKKLLLSFAAIALSIGSAQADVTINETNFPDENFRWSMEGIDNGDGVLTDEEIAAVEGISFWDVQNFKGIEYFTELESLTIKSGNAKSVTLDLSKNKKLTSLTFNQETIKLGTLDISNTQLTELTIPTGSATTLTVLRAKNSQLTSLDLSSCTKIATLEISDNPTLTTLTMPSTASALKTFNCSNTGITPSLD